MLSAWRASPPARSSSVARPSSDSRTRPAEAALRIGQRAVDDLAQRIGVERLQAVDPHPRQERRVDLVVRVLGRRADQRDRAVLDVRQQRVLLALVEPMQLVDEGDRRGRRPPAAPSPRPPARGCRRRRWSPRESWRHVPPARSASSRASVVLPLPGGPHRMSDGRWPGLTTRVSAPSVPTRCGWPTNSSSVRGRMRAASGASAATDAPNSGSVASARRSASGHGPIMMRGMEQNLRTPGPTPIPQAVREAQAQQMIDHRGTEFAELLRETSAGLAELIGTRGEVLLLTGSGSGALEAAIVNTLSPGDRVLVGHHRLVRRPVREDRDRLRCRRRRASRSSGAPPPTRTRCATTWRTPSRTAPCSSRTTRRRPASRTRCASWPRSCAPRPASRSSSSTASAAWAPCRSRWMPGASTSSSAPARRRGWRRPASRSRRSASARVRPARPARMPRFYWDFAEARDWAAKGQTPWTPAITVLYGLRVGVQRLREEGRERTWARHAAIARGRRGRHGGARPAAGRVAGASVRDGHRGLAARRGRVGAVQRRDARQGPRHRRRPGQVGRAGSCASATWATSGSTRWPRRSRSWAARFPTSATPPMPPRRPRRARGIRGGDRRRSVSDRRLVLVRHGVTDWNREGRFQGHLDPPLVRRRAARGRAARRAARRRTRTCGPRRIVTLDASRAPRRPPRPSARACGVEVEPDPRLIEIGQGEWEGRTHAELEVSDADRYRAWRDATPASASRPAASRSSRPRRAVAALLAELRWRPRRWPICLVSHGGTLRILAQASSSWPRAIASWALDVDNASLGVVARSTATVAARPLERHAPPAGTHRDARRRGRGPAAGAVSCEPQAPRGANRLRSHRRRPARRAAAAGWPRPPRDAGCGRRVMRRPEYACQTLPSATVRIGSPCVGSCSSSQPAYS